MGLNQAIDISTNQRKTILELLRKYLPNTTAWVYGSRVKWTSRPQSDLDMVVFAAPEQDRQVSNLREAFEESNLPFRVDLFVWDTVPEQFHEQIEADHVVLVEKEERKILDEWREGLWGDLATLEYGKALRGYRVGKGQFRVFGTNGPIGWHNEALCSHSSVVIGRKGAYRGVHYSAKPFFVIDTAFYLKPKSEIDTRWAYYELLTQDINGLDSGSAIPSTSRDEFYSLPVMIPPLSEQRVIAHILGTLDDKIELNRRMNQTLEEIARALFKSWFVDFDPVRAKMEGRDTGLPSHITGLFPDRLIPSELGEIPEGWEVKPLGELLVATNARVGKIDVPAYSCTNHGLVLRSKRFKKKLSVSNSKNKIIHNGDFVFGLSRRVLNFGLMQGHIGCVSPAYRTYSTNGHMVIPVLLEEIMRLRSEYYYLAVSASSREGQSISQDALRELKVVLPNITIQQKLYDLVDILTLRSKHLLAEIRTLAAQRDALLPKLISGELRVE